MPRAMEARTPLQRLPADSPGAKPGRPLEDEDCSLTILCPDVEDGGGTIDDLSPSDTLATLRAKILEEFDEDQLPNGVKDGSVDFFFKIGSSRCSTSQESKKRALDIKTAITIVAKKQKAAPPPPVGASASDAPGANESQAPRAADRDDANESSCKRQKSSVDFRTPPAAEKSDEMAPPAAIDESEAAPAADSVVDEPAADAGEPFQLLPCPISSPLTTSLYAFRYSRA